jgi:hypothetical protein
VVEPLPRVNAMPRPVIPRLSSEPGSYAPPAPPPAAPEPVGPNLNDLRAAVDALKKPRRPEPVAEQLNEETSTNNNEEAHDQARH